MIAATHMESFAEAVRDGIDAWPNEANTKHPDAHAALDSLLVEWKWARAEATTWRDWYAQDSGESIEAITALSDRTQVAEARVTKLREALGAFFAEWDGTVGTYAPTDETAALMRFALNDD